MSFILTPPAAIPTVRGQAARTLLWDFERDGISTLSASAASCTIASSSFDGTGAALITGTGVAQLNCDIALSTVVPAFTGGLGLDIIADRSKTTSLSMLASADAGFAAYAQIGSNPAAAANTSCLTYRTIQPYFIGAFPGGATADPSWSPGYQGTWIATPPTYPTELNKARIRALNVGGQIPLIYLRRIYALAPRKSRVVFTIDDGYATAYRLLKPVLDSFKIKASWAIIADLIGTSATYIKTSDLSQLFDEGHELITHGPVGGAGNIVDNYPTVAAAIADAEYHRGWLASQNILSDAASHVYTWPQGKHQAATNDLTYRDAMRAKGFTIGRTASTFTSSCVSDFWPDKLTLPIIGHLQAASAGAEATNIAAIVSAINMAALRGTDVILMNHAGVASTDVAWGSNGGLNIRDTDYSTICAAVAANIAAGTQQFALLSDL